jgi:hypothetical protein
MVCMKLHSLCIDRNVVVPNHRFVGDIRERDQWVVYDNPREDDAFHGRVGSGPWHDITAN